MKLETKGGKLSLRGEDNQDIIIDSQTDQDMDFSSYHYLLPEELRSELAKPQGELISGTIEETLPKLKQKLYPHEYILVAVGDVTADLFVRNGFKPDIIVTDGQTKREKLEEWKEYDNFTVLEATCPAAEITPEAWKQLKIAIEKCNREPVHVKIHGEEDLLVLPLLIELPIGAKIVYGQPNTGAVIRTVSHESRESAKEIINKMERNDKN